MRKGRQTEDTTTTVNHVLWGIYRLANRMRENHFTDMRSPRLVSPGQVLHPANFMEHLDRGLNSRDPFYNTFKVPFAHLDDGLKESLVTVKVC
jgi:hypothetical protein